MNRSFLMVILLAGIMLNPARDVLGQETNEVAKKPRDFVAERREFMERHRDELKGLPPEARQAKVRELRQKELSLHPELRPLTPEERLAKRKELRERMQKQLAELRKKKADGTLDPFEKRRLERMEEVAKRFEQTGARLGDTNLLSKPSTNAVDK